MPAGSDLANFTPDPNAIPVTFPFSHYQPGAQDMTGVVQFVIGDNGLVVLACVLQQQDASWTWYGGNPGTGQSALQWDGGGLTQIGYGGPNWPYSPGLQTFGQFFEDPNYAQTIREYIGDTNTAVQGQLNYFIDQWFKAHPMPSPTPTPTPTLQPGQPIPAGTTNAQMVAALNAVLKATFKQGVNAAGLPAIVPQS